MRQVVEFCKTTIVGGLLVLLPAYVSLLLLLRSPIGARGRVSC
jgi:hypothetical protein